VRAAAFAAALLLPPLFAVQPLHAARVELTLQQPNGRPLAGAVLYALPLDARRLPPAASAVMDQRDRRFVPQILPVQTGAAVSFPNTDSISHHVYSFSPAKRFELYLPKNEGRTGRGQSQRGSSQVIFDRAGVAALGCNIHDWMLAYIDVVDSPFFAVTGADGAAALADLPAGTYRLEAWHPRLVDPPAMLHRQVTLQAGSREQWSLRLEKALLPARDQRPRFVDY
jgi:plastocyanin